MTAEEDHGHGKRIVRCRIESRPSFAARFSLLALSSLGVLVAFTSFSWWGGLAVVSLPVIWGLLQRDQRSIRHLIKPLSSRSQRFGIGTHSRFPSVSSCWRIQARHFELSCVKSKAVHMKQYLDLLKQFMRLANLEPADRDGDVSLFGAQCRYDL